MYVNRGATPPQTTETIIKFQSTLLRYSVNHLSGCSVHHNRAHFRVKGVKCPVAFLCGSSMKLNIKMSTCVRSYRAVQYIEKFTGVG